jgi:hypothetical protein
MIKQNIFGIFSIKEVINLHEKFILCSPHFLRNTLPQENNIRKYIQGNLFILTTKKNNI